MAVATASRRKNLTPVMGDLVSQSRELGREHPFVELADMAGGDRAVGANEDRRGQGDGSVCAAHAEIGVQKRGLGDTDGAQESACCLAAVALIDQDEPYVRTLPNQLLQQRHLG